MEFKFSKDKAEGEAAAQGQQEKGRQTGMLVLLLILLGGFGYIYFFTGLIRPQEPPPAPPQAPQVVKQPLPARDAAPPVAKTADPKTETPPSAAVPAAAPAAKEQQKPADVKAAVQPAVKPEPAKSAPQAVKQPEQAKPTVTKQEPKKAVPPAKTEDKKSVAATADPLKQAEPAKKASAAAKTNGPWTVVVGLYVVEETLAEDMAKVKKAGLSPVMTSGPKRPVTMHRLFYGDFSSKEQAQQAVETLKRTAGGGFAVQRGEKHEVFAGSYAVLSGAQSEQQRLAAAGVKVTVRKSQVPLASRKLTVGTFTDRKAANDALKKLKAAGIGAPEIE